MNRKRILFDCYQTLLDTDIDRERQNANKLKGWETFAGSLNERHGIRIDVKHFVELLQWRQAEYYREHDERVYHHNLTELVSDALEQDMKIALPNNVVSELLYEYRKVSRGYVRVYPDVRDVLSRLAAQYELSLASYTQSAFTVPELQELGIDGYFSHLIFSSDIGLRKGTPDFYNECLRIVGAEASDCIMVGDNYHDDILVPAELGISGVWIRNPMTCKGDSPSADATPVPIVDLESFEELPEVVGELFSSLCGIGRK
ncbi:MAG: HAD family hydrolase [Candidatus Moraniibacteriota bacterium]